MGWRPQPRWDGRRYRVRLRGKAYSLGTDYAEALARFAELYTRVMGVNPSLPTPRIVSELIAAWCDEVKASKWQWQMLDPWERYTKNLQLSAIEDSHLEEYHAWCKRQRRRRYKGTERGTVKTRQPWSPETIKHFVDHASRVLAWANRKGLIAASPPRPRLDPPGYVPRDLSAEEIAKVLRTLDASVRLRHTARIVRFMLLTGCRPKEARLLKWSQVRLSQGVCLIADHKTRRRTGETRSIVLSEEAVTFLGLLPGRKQGHVFKSRLGTPYTRDGLCSILSRVGIHPYQLRHTWAQMLVDGGGDLAAISAGMGHQSLKTTGRYARIRDQRVFLLLHGQASPLQRAAAASLPRRSTRVASARARPKKKRP